MNPAVGLRETLALLHPPGLLKWDTSGRALIVSSAPRHGVAGEGFAAGVRRLGLRLEEARSLLYIDFSEEAYAQCLDFSHEASAQCLCFSEEASGQGAIEPGWFEVQSLLAGILGRKVEPTPLPPDIPLLRGAMLACAQGEKHVRAFAEKLRLADAAALRLGSTASARACAVLLAEWLWAGPGVGVMGDGKRWRYAPRPAASGACPLSE